MRGVEHSCENAVFARALAAMKRRGSNLLVVGECGHSSQTEACARFLGTADGEPRCRLFVLADEADPRNRIEGAVETESVRVVRIPTSVRSVADSGSRSDLTSNSVARDGLTRIARGILTEIDSFERDNGGFEAGELRVCLDSLVPLLSNYRDEAIFRFLHVLTWRIRRANGMGHVHFPVSEISEGVRLFAPLFETVIEIQHVDADIEHRWHLRDHDLTSEWLTL